MLCVNVINKPFVYVRDKAKGHGLENLIEGKLEIGQRVVVIEDLISTGGSSLKAVTALREAGAEVLGLGAIFTYGFQKSVDAFAEADCKFFTLSEYPILLEIAAKLDYIKPEEKETLIKWYQNPAGWLGQTSS